MSRSKHKPEGPRLHLHRDDPQSPPTGPGPAEGADLHPTGSLEAAPHHRTHGAAVEAAEPPRLVFPRQALDIAARQPKPSRLVQDIESTLEGMQKRLDVIKDEVHNLRFPTPTPPTTRATPTPGNRKPPGPPPPAAA